MKTYLSSMPTLLAPEPHEPLLLYIATTNQEVSAALVVEWEVDEAVSTTIVPSREESEPIMARSCAVQDKEEQDYATTSKPTRSQLSPASLCNAYSETPRPLVE